MEIKLMLHGISNKKAFGIIETLIAVTVLTFVLLASVVLASTSLRNMTIRAQTVQANVLAQSQIEKIRNIRDNVWLRRSYASCPTHSWDCWVGVGRSAKVVANKTYKINQTASGDFYLLETSSPDTKLLKFGRDSTVEYQTELKINQVDNMSKVTVEGSSDLLELNKSVSGKNEIKIYLIESNVTWWSYDRENRVDLKTYISDWQPKS